ncbi:amidohydrolase family protein [Pseudofrankia asymbiotica]|uniref:Amidohydrolase-related domain-containing protein n=1 Tax=Pseudofrankia asymbiotica TaxID=1834516 RepID=A0A1V2I7Z9_9ACTN|nr:amidohydrolase family protein [Pseudofrankia asymbiotica]ONH28017.1 hypothetical protein BL253_20650 [Pseudofrankia asymbiotica]
MRRAWCRRVGRGGGEMARRWATVNGAAAYGAPDDLDVVAPGRLADLLVVDGDPVEDVSILSDSELSLLAVLKNGELVTDRLDELAAVPA